MLILLIFTDNMKPKKPIDITLGTEPDSQMAEVLSSDKLGVESTASSSDSEEDDVDDSDEDGADDARDADYSDDDDDYGDQDEEGGGDDADDMQGFGASTAAPGSAAAPTPVPTSASPLANSQAPAAQPTGQQVPTPDPYFTHFDPRGEHQAFKEAQQRLEEMHREKVTKVGQLVVGCGGHQGAHLSFYFPVDNSHLLFLPRLRGSTSHKIFLCIAFALSLIKLLLYFFYL